MPPLGSQRALSTSDTARGVLARAALLAAAYFLAALGSIRIALALAYSIPIWPASGIAVAGMLLLPARVAAPAVFVASFVACLSSGVPSGVSIGVSIATVLAAWLPAVVLRHVAGFSPSLRTARDVALFAVVAGIATPALGAGLAIATVALGGLGPASQLPGIAFGWWAGGAIGVVLFAPAILAFARPIEAPTAASGALECVALTVCVILAGLFPFATGLAHDTALLFFAAGLVPPLLWAAIRHDRRALVLTNLSLAGLSLLLLLATGESLDPVHFREHAAVLQVFVGVVATMGLVVSGALIEWRTAEVDRRASAERFRAAAEGGFDAFGILRALRGAAGTVNDFEVVELNERARKLLHAVHPEPEGRLLTEVFPRIKSGQVFGHLVGCFERGVPREDEHRVTGLVLPSDFPVECLRVVIVPLSDGVAVTLRDITESKRLEAQLAQAVKLEAVGRLAGGVAHDFNNLLTAISGYGEIALAQLPSDSPVRADVQEMLHAGERAATLTRQLLAFSRRQVLQREAIDLNDVVRDTAALLGRVLGADVRLVTDLASALAPVLADPGQFQQLVMNLALNARDALPNGGEVRISTRVVALRESEARRWIGVTPGRYVQIEVRDDGIGMDEETRARIFEPFFTTKPHGKGTGLGLAIVYGIVQQSNGHISVDSTPGRGTRFEILLPIHDGPVRAAPPTAEPARAPASVGRTVLLAEDEEPLRKLIERVLASAGLRVLVGRDGVEALRLAASHLNEIDLLVTDIVMPQLGGRALAAELRRQRPGLPVLFVSGFDAEGARATAADPAASNFLPKPFTADALLALVRDLLERSEPWPVHASA